MPHFRSGQPGETYYYSPLGIYLFGVVNASEEPTHLRCFYYKEGVSKKGGNNVASLLFKNAQLNGAFQQEHPLKCYNMIMDNCGGQNKNQMVIRYFLMMAEIQVYEVVNLIFLVRGHTKNV